MKKRIAALLVLALLVVAQGVPAESLGQYAREQENQARLSGMEVRTETSFVWGGLPLLEDKENDALNSLTQAVKIVSRRQGGDNGGYVGMDVYLQDISVLDMTMLRQDGVYYEQSNLLGGQTVAFTKEEFAGFSRALSDQTDGVLPQNLGWMFELVMLALGGGGDLPVNTELIDSAVDAFDAWQADALQEKERLRPTVYIPGLYGARAVVRDVTREEALALVDVFVTLVSGENALWEDAVRAQIPGDDANQTQEALAQVEALLGALPEMATGLLPKGMKAAEYREIYDLDGELAAKQAELSLGNEVALLLEWIPMEKEGVPAFYAALTVGESRITLLFTREDGAPTVSGKTTRQRNRFVAEWMLEDPALALNMIITRTENIELREEKETITAKTDWMLESEALFGEGAIVTVSLGETDTVSGQGEKYARKHTADWTIKGLGFDNQKILTIVSDTRFVEADSRIELEGDIVRPAQLTGEALDEWLKNVRVSFMQAVYTCLGRLPADVAAVILGKM